MPMMMPAEKEAEVVKNLKSYTKRYDEEDEQMLQQADQDVLLERKQLLVDWETWVEGKQVYVDKLQSFKLEMYGDMYKEKPYGMERVTVEQVLDVREEPFQN
jgi:translation initiation factor 3 subunit B